MRQMQLGEPMTPEAKSEPAGDGSTPILVNPEEPPRDHD